MNNATNENVRRVGILAPMKPELLPIVKVMKLERGKLGAIPVSVGRVGNVDVIALMTGIGMEPATKVTGQLLDSTEIDHVIVVGISDLAGDSAIDPEIMKLSGPDGSGSIVAVARYLVQKPSRIKGLLRLTNGMRAATTLAANAAKRACESVKPA